VAGRGTRAGAALALALALPGASGAAPEAVAPEAPAPQSEAPPGGATPFPTPERLEDLAEKPPPEDAFSRPVAVVDAWTLEGPFPDVAAAVPYRDPSDWGGLLEVEAARRAGLVVATEAMHCAAREWGRFRLEHGAPPAPELSRWMAARCSVSVASVGFHHFEGGVPEGADEAEIFDSWRGAVASLLRQRLVGGPQTAGVWFGRRDGRALLAIATGERVLRMDPVPTVLGGDDPRVVIGGEVLVQASEIGAAVNQGRYGVAACERDRALRLPRFAFRCETRPGDASTWISVSVTPPGRLLGRGALELLVWPAGEPEARWTRPSYADPLPVTPETDVPEALAGLVNGIRAEAGLDPLELAPAQSRIASRIAPWFFASLFGAAPPESGDAVILGLMAGWHVDGVVQSAEFAASWVAQSGDLSHLVSSTLQHPTGRKALLDPDARRMAVGAIVRDDGERRFVAGIYGTYALFDEAAHDAGARRVVEALDAARKAAGRPPIHHLPDVAALGRLAASRVQAGEKPDAVLGDLLHQSSQVLQRSVNGWFLEARDLGAVTFPEELVQRDVVALAVGVSHRRPEGEPWGRYVVLLVAADPEGAGA